MKFPFLLLDLSTAFDTVDYIILINHSENTFKGMILDWLASYLSERSFSVAIGDFKFESISIPFGVPQGSILSPLD